MYRKLVAVVAVYLALSAATARADDTRVRLLPQYTECTHTGERYACYTFDQQLQLNRLEEQALHWHRQMQIALQQYTLTSRLVNNLERQLAEAHSVEELQSERISHLTNQLYLEIEAKNQYRAEAESTDWWPLIIGGAVGILGIGLGLGLYLKSSL